MTALRLVIPPARPAVDLDYVKTKVRVEHNDHDEILTAYIAAEVAAAEGPDGFTGRVLIDQTWDLFLDGFPGHHTWGHHRPRGRVIEIPLPPLIEVVDLTYQDNDGVEQDVDLDTYDVDTASQPGRIALLDGKSWPVARHVANAVRIRFRAGYLDQTQSPPVDAVPENIKLGIFMRVYADYGPFDKDAADKIREAGEMFLRGKRVQLGMA